MFFKTVQWIVAAALCAALAVAGPGVDFDSDYAAAKKEWLPKLVTFADWCATTKLFVERDKALQAVLRLDPNHEGAHRALKHTQQRDGTWVVPEKRPEPHNYGASLKDCLKRRSELVAELRTRWLALAETHAATISPSARAELLADVLAADPDDAESRALVGEVKQDEQWVLLETQTSKARRAALRDLIKQAAAAVASPEAAESSASEAALSIAWSALVQTPRVRVLSSGGLEEARKVAIMCTAAADVFRQVTGAELDLPPGFSIYLLTTAVARDSFIAGWPGWKDEERARLKTWAGAGVPGDVHVGRWDADEARRLDGAVRHVLGVLTLLNFGYDHQVCAWAWEGFGLYLTREIVGTRFTWYSTGPSSGDAESKELLGKMMMSDVNWMNECYQRAKRKKAVKLAALCERKIDQFGIDEVLTSYAFAAYLVEGRPEMVGTILKNIRAQGPAKALSGTLNVQLDQLDERFVRWLGERK